MRNVPPCACAPQFDMFLRNNYGLLWMLFFLFQLPMNSIAYILSAVIRNSQTAMYAGFGLFLVGWIMQASHAAVH